MWGHWVQGDGEGEGTQMNTVEPALPSVLHAVDQGQQAPMSPRLSLTVISCASKKASTPANKKWMEHLQVPQRALDRRLLARMQNRNHYLKNPRFFPPNTPHGGKSLIVPSRKPERRGSLSAKPEWRCVCSSRRIPGNVSFRVSLDLVYGGP